MSLSLCLGNRGIIKALLRVCDSCLGFSAVKAELNRRLLWLDEEKAVLDGLDIDLAKTLESETALLFLERHLSISRLKSGRFQAI